AASAAPSRRAPRAPVRCRRGHRRSPPPPTGARAPTAIGVSRSLPTRRHRTARAAAAPARLFVDSGGWIALRSRRDQYHAEADRLFREALQFRIPLVTTHLVIAEAHRLTLFPARLQPARPALQPI